MADAGHDDQPARQPSVGVSLEGASRRLTDADLRWLEDRCARAAAFLGASGGEVRVRGVGDAEMAEAHERHCGVAGTTDVITFDLAAGGAATGGALDVDLLVCLDEAERQASARGHGVREEVLLYMIHGVLHCLGFDDHDEEEAAAMHARQDEALAAVGVAPISAAGRVAS